MTSVVEDTPRLAAFSPEASAELGKALHDSQQLATLRAAAAEHANTVPLPDPRKERPWKYMKMSLLDLSRYTPAHGASWRGSNDEILARFGLAEAKGAVLAPAQQRHHAHPSRRRCQPQRLC